MAVPRADAKQHVEALVERFGRNLAAYKRPDYKETRVRVEFIDPFFEALGWDVRNVQGYAEQYKDVVHEAALKAGGTTQAPDYSFRVGGMRKLFLEAKRPAVQVKGDVGPAYQLRRYAWSAKLPLSILTDFEEFAVYDCRQRPKPTDRASAGRVTYLTFDQYPDRFDEIHDVFARESVLKGSFDRYVQDTTRKRGTSEVDAEFLREIEGWRDVLARNIALRNPGLSVHELNFAVQRTIDRIIFLRICEARAIEEYGRLLALTSGLHIYARMHDLYRLAEEKYDSSIFDFGADTLSKSLTIDDQVLKPILAGLYYPQSPYEFSVFPADILGQVYEQFLGKVIRLTPAHRAKVEEKPEVKKAGGVYYTPTYIVDYIVRQTVGRLVEGKTPRQIGKLRILDLACGSGSFLLGAYQYLLDYHRRWYEAHDPARHAGGRQPALYQGRQGEWRLTTAEKKRILLNNVYGVDIDRQAVEVTKLSLLLKVLEDESQETLGQQLTLWRERALPDLGDNVKCGNSLIGPDYFEAQLLPLENEEEMRRVNPFDWEREFPEVMAAGGFDAVIGNPPYLNIDDTWGKGDTRQRYIKRAYSAVYNDKTDILFYFLAKAVQVGRGEIGLIVSRAFLEAYKADKLRAYLAEHTNVREIIDFRNYYVFQGVGITTAIVIFSKTERAQDVRIYQLQADSFKPDELTTRKEQDTVFQSISVAQGNFGAASWTFAESNTEATLRKIDDAGEPLGSVLIVGQGMQTGRNNVFGKLNRDQIEAWGLEEGQYFTRARNSDILRYCIRDRGEILLYPEDVERFDDLPNGVQDYLESHKATLRKRAAYQRGDCDWWRYTWPLHKQYLHRAKLCCPYLAASNRFALDEQQKYLGLTDTTVLYDAGQPEQLRYLMGLLNSQLLTFRFRFIGKLKSGGILEYFWNGVSKLPIRRINFDDPADVARHDKMVALVERMLALHQKLAAATISADKQLYQRQIEATDRAIDALVYELRPKGVPEGKAGAGYGLSEEEIAIVEGC
jgi:type I restriction-modification system DNA methylase subunit/predicted type IV restriction endonuclease